MRNIEGEAVRARKASCIRRGAERVTRVGVAVTTAIIDHHSESYVTVLSDDLACQSALPSHYDLLYADDTSSFHARQIDS